MSKHDITLSSINQLRHQHPWNHQSAITAAYPTEKLPKHVICSLWSVNFDWLKHALSFDPQKLNSLFCLFYLLCFICYLPGIGQIAVPAIQTYSCFTLNLLVCGRGKTLLNIPVRVHWFEINSSFVRFFYQNVKKLQKWQQ